MSSAEAPRQNRGQGRRNARSGGGSRSAQRPSQRARAADPARSVAFRVLRSAAEGGYANLELPRLLRDRRLTGRDAAFATELCYGTLRLRGWYDAVLASASDRGPDKIDPPVLDALRLGAHQLLGMRVPSHAAVSSTVALVRSEIGVGPSGFVNAVLRRVDEATGQEWADRILPTIDDPWERLAVEYSHPAWQVRALRAALVGHGGSAPDPGESAEADLTALLGSHNTAAEVTLVARPGLGAEAEVERAGATRHPAVPTAYQWPGGDPASIAAVRDGRAAVQDAGSQVVALTLAAAHLDGPDATWLDLCAGPGGKAGVLGAIAVDRGADLVANEISTVRTDLVRTTLGPVSAAAAERGRSIEIVTGDGREVGGQSPGRFDRVLVDAPCTGLGALRRRPEARWRRTPDDLATLSGLQRELLASAIDATRVGGVIVYATCSPHLAETSFVVHDVTKRRGDVELEDIRPVVADVVAEQWAPQSFGDGPGAVLWPHRHGTDGMYLALLRKVGE